MECNSGYSWCSTGNRTCVTCAFFGVGVMKTCGSEADIKELEEKYADYIVKDLDELYAVIIQQ